MTREKFAAFLIDHSAGKFPLWLAPDQVSVLSIGAEDDPASAPLVKYAKAIAKELSGQRVRQRIKLQLSSLVAMCGAQIVPQRCGQAVPMPNSLREGLISLASAQ